MAHNLVFTNAAGHNSPIIDELMQGQEQAIYSDKAYSKQEKKQECESKGIKW